MLLAAYFVLRVLEMAAKQTFHTISLFLGRVSVKRTHERIPDLQRRSEMILSV